jgi:hypothetical protein
MLVKKAKDEGQGEEDVEHETVRGRCRAWDSERKM